MGTYWKNLIAMVIQRTQTKLTDSLLPSLSPREFTHKKTTVTTLLNGESVSAYGDWLWDFRYFVASNKGDGILYFNKEPYLSNPGILQDVKHLLWHLIKLNFYKKKTHSVSAYLRWASALHCLSNYCTNNNLSIATCLTQEKLCLEFVHKFCPQPRKRTAASMLKMLFSLTIEEIGCKMFDAYHSELSTSTESNQEEQTLVIPSRLLFKCIKTTKKIVSDFNLHLEDLKLLTLEMHRETAKYSGARQYLHEGKISPLRFNELIDQYNLRKLSEHYKWNNSISFGRYLSEVQFSSKTLIHIYSGMRDDEAYSLLPGCLCEETVDGEVGYWLHGIATKGYGRKKPAAWVTSLDVCPAITVCEAICDWIKIACKIERAIPLFSNISHFAFALSHNRIKPNENGNKFSNLTHATFNRIFKTSEFIISEKDSIEVQFIEYARNWDAEEIYITGVHWHFTTHQFRRSLAYYGIESGLIRFSSLHEQLQHIRMQMTTHYSKGGSVATSLIGNSTNHFQHEFKRVTTIVRALDYVKTILLSDEELIGGYGKHVEKNIKPLGKEHILIHRQKTIEQVQAGLLAYTPRATGGCMNPNPCHRHLINPLSACVGCAHAALIPSRIRLAVSTFNDFLATLQPNSPEQISAIKELNIITDHFQRQNIELA
ncbi:hypothetical protein [Pseudomonas sp. K2I15]|uniref:hypothetical protein n=1 Tax=Pseudomonas sp. K2I15 TaxID=2013577 RepID=UPI0011310896|nr:hypothetical protein [Pseudomonas sp. K2I15]